MASIIKAGNATDGVQVSSDATGALDIKTGTGAGTTAISIDASQNVAIPGTLTVGGFPAGGNYALQQYVAPATWSKPAGLKAVKVTIVGAGGSGGPVAAANASYKGGGGGGGGAAIEYIPAPSIPGPVAVTAGPGTNSFGPFCSATAGTNAATVSNPAVVQGAGGAAGVGSGGNINLIGESGTPASGGASGGGGMAALGFGFGAPAVASPGSNGSAAPSPSYGGGGSGAIKASPNFTAYTGGAGAPGIVIVEEFY
jgi:hypothetical protein